MDVGVRDLELIEALEGYGTLTAAAQGLHISQPALSQRLKTLEQRLGTALYERRGRQLVTTASGKRMHAAAQSALAELRAAQLDVRLIAEGREQPVAVTSQCTTNYSWLAPVLRTFRSRVAGVEVQLRRVNDRETTERLLDGSLDVALVTKLESQMDQIRLQRLFDDQLVAVVSVDHPWAARTSVTARAVEAAHLVLFDSYDQSRVPAVPLPLPVGTRPARLTTVAAPADLLIEMVAPGNCATVLPAWLAAPHVGTGQFVTVPFGPTPLVRTWYCATRYGEQSPSVLTFAQVLLEQMAGHGPVALDVADASGPTAG